MRRHLTLRRRLLLMALSLIAPAAVFMALLVAAEYRSNLKRFEDQLIATTRALSLANDRQLAQGQVILRALAVSPALERGDFGAFEEQARRATAGASGWIVLSDPQGQLVNTLPPAGTPLPKAKVPDATWAALRRGETVVSDLASGTVLRRPIIAIDAPVLSGGRVLDLAYIQEPAALRSIFTGQRVPASWTASIVDRRGRLVARSKDQDRFLGRTASPDMLRALASRDEGLVVTKTLDGTRTFSAFSRSPAYGWSFIVGVPRSEVTRSLLEGIWFVALAAVVLLALGAGLAVLFARSISRETRTLVQDAQALTVGGSIASRPRDLWETAQVRRALQDASRQLQERQRETEKASARQQLMINELNHRVKNTLATVQSLANQTLGREADDPRAGAFSERLLALARAHDLLTERVWEGAELGDVIRRTLQPYGGRARASGPSVSLAPNTAVSLSMVFHELATNAAKYGALSREAGLVEVVWSVDRARERLHLSWREAGGPPVAPPARRGFGGRLLEASVRHELGGEVRHDYATDGVVCELDLPLSAQVRASAP